MAFSHLADNTKFWKSPHLYSSTLDYGEERTTSVIINPNITNWTFFRAVHFLTLITNYNSATLGYQSDTNATNTGNIRFFQ